MEALLKYDTKMANSILDNLYAEGEGITPEYEEDFLRSLNWGETLNEVLEYYDEYIISITIHNTSLAIPYFISSSEAQWYDLINEGGDTAAYNTSYLSEEDMLVALSDYKAYLLDNDVEITDEIIDETDIGTDIYFSAEDEMGNEFLVRASNIKDKFFLLQVIVPSFEETE